jgi:hypothetical protein
MQPQCPIHNRCTAPSQTGHHKRRPRQQDHRVREKETRECKRGRERDQLGGRVCARETREPIGELCDKKRERGEERDYFIQRIEKD